LIQQEIHEILLDFQGFLSPAGSEYFDFSSSTFHHWQKVQQHFLILARKRISTSCTELVIM